MSQINCKNNAKSTSARPREMMASCPPAKSMWVTLIDFVSLHTTDLQEVQCSYTSTPHLSDCEARDTLCSAGAASSLSSLCRSRCHTV